MPIDSGIYNNQLFTNSLAGGLADTINQYQDRQTKLADLAQQRQIQGMQIDAAKTQKMQKDMQELSFGLSQGLDPQHGIDKNDLISQTYTEAKRRGLDDQSIQQLFSPLTNNTDNATLSKHYLNLADPQGAMKSAWAQQAPKTTEIHDKVQDSNGNWYGVTRDGKTIPLDVKGQTKSEQKSPEFAQLLNIRDSYAAKGDTRNVSLIDAQIKKMNEGLPRPESSTPLVPIIGEDGKPTLATRTEAHGKTPYNPAALTLGGREGVQFQRVILATNQVSKDLENITKLPLATTRGVLGGRDQGKSLFEATKESLANSVTSQDAQTYNVMATGIQRNLAAIEAAGLMPSGSLTHQMDSVIIKEGDTNLTKLQKLAQVRQIAEAGIETLMSHPRVADEQKKQMKNIQEKLIKAVPFTQEELNALQIAQETNPKATLKSVMDEMKKTQTNPNIEAILQKHGVK